jgi:6-phosphofructokinase 1
MKKIAFITSGGDSPGMNTAIRGIVKTSIFYGITPYGVYDGFQGLIENKIREFTYDDINNIIFQGGTVLGTSRSEQFKTKEGRLIAYENLQRLGIEALIVIGGDGSLKGASIFSKEFDFPIVGLPGTIDNDMYGTDFTIGFDTTINTIVENVDKLRDTANSHHRMFFVEVMGRNSGFIALHAAIASGAEMVLIPEQQKNINEIVDSVVCMNKGKRGSIFIVAEGENYGGAESLIQQISPYLTNFDVRSTVLGHVQRGGRPSAFDRVLATKLAVKAVDSLVNGNFNVMIGMINNQIISSKIEKVIDKRHKINPSEIAILEKLLTLYC